MMVSICFVLEFLQVFLEKKKKPNTQNFNADYEVGYFLIFHVNWCFFVNDDDVITFEYSHEFVNDCYMPTKTWNKGVFSI